MNSLKISMPMEKPFQTKYYADSKNIARFLIFQIFLPQTE